MIKIEKDLENIPNSLLDDNVMEKRNLCIQNFKYNKKFNQRFKQRDTKELLSQIAHGKCSFCEQKIFKCTDGTVDDCSTTIEHYRPKSTYYWLAFSWDNLLWCCHRCNQNKGNSFELNAQRVDYNSNFHDNIHSSAKMYHIIEQPLMIHPELENILEELSFFDGIISSDDTRVKYTIGACGMDRVDLNEKRKLFIDEFIKKVNAQKVEGKSINIILTELLNDVTQREKEFIALRYWILKNYKSLIEEV